MWYFFSLCFNLTTMPWICPPAFAPVAPREDRADLVSTLSAKPSSVLQGKDFTFPGCVFVGHIFDHFLFRWRLRRLCLARILTSKKTFRSNNSTSNAKKKLPLYSEVIHSTFQVNKLTLEKVTRQRQRLEVSETIRSDILRYYFPEKLENINSYIRSLHSCCYRNSSFMFYNYMGKKFVEICFIFVALFFNRWICHYL